MFNKILVANRGEIAMRVIRTCKEMGIKTVAVYSKADEESLHVRFADEAVCIGPSASSDSYLKPSNIIAAAEITNADAIHPGYGFLSENSKFSKICEEHKIKFIGASPEMIDKMGDKSSAKETMKAAGVPTIPGSEGLVPTLEDAQNIALEIGYPVMLKATAGGGGKGMRIAKDAKELSSAWELARQESKLAFDNDDMYLEKFIEDPRHIEIQIIGDSYGKACHLSERDCSIQRRHQKLIEETPSPVLNDEIRKDLFKKTVNMVSKIGYEGAGTVEFIYEDGKFYFLEMNTRVQVEHPVSEMVTGIDIIKEQINIAFTGETALTQSDINPRGHAIECRINAEDPSKNFQPSPGTIGMCHQPSGFRTRVDGAIFQGYKVTPYYDSMICKLICHGRNRIEAIQRMNRSLDEFVIEGIITTIPLHKKLLNHKKFLNSDFNVSWLDKEKVI